MFIATLVATDRLSAGDISAACDVVQGTAGPVRDGVACDISFAMRSSEGWSLREESAARPSKAPAFAGALVAVESAVSADVIIQHATHRDRKLLVADMDSTMITVECIDELADYAGLKAEVSEVTERAMRGEIDFAGALHNRVALLAGMKESTITECLNERVKLMGGAKELVTAFRAAGGEAILVSGGFTHFTGPVAAEIGFDCAIANRLIVKDGVLTGAVEQPIVDAQTKRAVLLDALNGRDPSISIAIGDGANDIPMIEAAGLGVAYHAKPKTQAAADACVRFGDLNVVRYALGL
jgi:phosphoserine phosphatase